MKDIIKILPDLVANQIAAGEVIQRPSSAVKELLENAIDATATDVNLIIKDAGRTLIQIIDNGKGMSETDARLCFERHATSKIRESEDLFSIKTMGFRGEALASIAAISHVELKTKREIDELGTQIIIEGGEVKSQTPCSCSTGTSIAVKNLFFNVPARRNFLKSNNTELSYIIEELYRIALVNPQINFTYSNNGKEEIHLDKGTLKNRVIKIFGNNFDQRILPLETNSNIVEISGYVCKPEFVKKSRGEQYFFVNNRFIKHPYFHHAVQDSFFELIPTNTFVSYFIYLKVDPKTIDINIHPTKTEVKFYDERSIYMMLKSAVKQSLGKFSITPSLDFEFEKPFDFNIDENKTGIKIPTIKVDPYFNPFYPTNKNTTPPRNDLNKQHWEKLYEIATNKDLKNNNEFSSTTHQHSLPINPEEGVTENIKEAFLVFQNKYIVSNLKSGLVFIDITRARERIFYERLLNNSEGNPDIQSLLYPLSLEFNSIECEIISEILDELKSAGFDIEHFGGNTFIVNGAPHDVEESDIYNIIHSLIENYKNNISVFKKDKINNLSASIAKSMASKAKIIRTNEEMQAIAGQLFSCRVPNTSPSGKPTLFIMTNEDVELKFK